MQAPAPFARQQLAALTTQLAAGVGAHSAGTADVKLLRRVQQLRGVLALEVEEQRVVRSQ